MSSRLRRSLVLTTLLALLLGVSGTAAPIGVAANPPNTKVAGIDVDATTIPELQQFMNSHRMNSVELTNFYLRRIRQLNPMLNAVVTVSPTARAARATTVRCSGFRSSSRTTSTPPACRRQPAPGHSPGAHPTTPSSRRN
jgi:hypothetical protein